MTRNSYLKALLVMAMVLFLASCHRDEDAPRLSLKQQQTFSHAIAGSYSGSYAVVYTDSLTTYEKVHEVQPDGSVKEMVAHNAHSETVADARLLITDDGKLYFHNFPCRLLAKIVDVDADLSQALSEFGSIDVTAQYKFFYENTEFVGWSFEPLNLPLTLNYRNERHYIRIAFSNANRFYRFPMKDLESGSFHFESETALQVEAIYEGEQLLQSFTSFDGLGNSMLITFK
ncbi:MAG: DUF4840 domain-containing protein [Bacteroidaceae bacterium]|nr:DUF4840 domain-containing protein [Bacteroidaceae bacterium]